MRWSCSGFETGKTSTATEGWGSIENEVEEARPPTRSLPKRRQGPELMLQAQTKQLCESTRSHRQNKPKKVPQLFCSPPVWLVG